MKEHIISYVLQDSQWWAGLNVTNHSFKPTTVLIEYYHSNGRQAGAQEIPLGAGCQTRFLAGPPYGWARAFTEENVTIVEIIGEVGKSVSGYPVEKRELILKNVVQDSKVQTPISDSRFVKTYAESNFLHARYITALELIARALHYEYPDRVAQKLEVVDATPLTGDAPGHPPGSHSAGDDSDFHYFTFGATNNTQLDGGAGLVSIWTDPVNLSNMFDAKRNMEFALLYKRVFPKAFMMMDSTIKTALMAAALQVHGSEAQDIIMASINGDDDPDHLMKHNLHMHLSYRDVIDWDAIL